ncbi:DUF3857 domain-containing protein, partial [Psychroserpens sp.]|uniref:DUF3857 domain-containing protein n=1 Tax=Psychroserpens sp. TaxID=2020870 RepID=UPI003C766F1F
LISLSQDFSNEDFIYLQRHENIKIELNDDRFNISKKVSEQADYLTSNKLYFANEAMHFDSFRSIEDIEAYTIVPNSNKKVNVNYIETKRDFDNGVFYSDQESKTFTFPAVTKGAVTHLNYTEIIKDPHFLGLFRFGTYVPTKSAELSIEFPSNVTIGHIDFNTQNIDLDFTTKTKGETTVYTWKVNNIDGFQGEEDSEAALYYLPHVIVYIKSYEKDGEIINVLSDVGDLYTWYVSLVDQINLDALDRVYAIADDIVAPLETDRQKAEAIFSWVQNNITYVAFEDGLGGFVPRGAASVCDKRYGDCKDMANLLYEMLNHVGVASYRTWIGTRNRNYSYFDVPTPMVDNHMITTAIVDKDTIFLDATDSYVPFGMPSAFTQTKEALLGISKDEFRVVKVPAQNAKQSKTIVSTEMELDGDRVKVSEKRIMTGYDKVEFISDYTYKKESKTEEQYLSTELALGNNKTNYNNITKSNFDNSIAPLELSYDLDIDSYTKSIGGKIYINLNIDRMLSKSDIDIKDRKYSKKIDYKFERDYTTTFKIPEGYKASYIPDEISFDDPNYGFKISYLQDQDTITQTKSIYVKTLSIKKDNFDQWNGFVKSLIKAYKKSIILEQI